MSPVAMGQKRLPHADLANRIDHPLGSTVRLLRSISQSLGGDTLSLEVLVGKPIGDRANQKLLIADEVMTLRAGRLRIGEHHILYAGRQ
jgi:hypothetical protein